MKKDAVIYPPFSFYATIAVSRRGIPTLISSVPTAIDYIIESDFPDDDGWVGLPKEPGVWRCGFKVVRRYEDVEVRATTIERLTVSMMEALTAGDVITPVSV